MRSELLTEIELARLAEYRTECLARGWATGPVDRPAIEKNMAALYSLLNLPMPELVVWRESPLGGVVAVSELSALEASGKTTAEIKQLPQFQPDYVLDINAVKTSDIDKKFISSSMRGSQDLFWVGFYSFVRELGVTYDDKSNDLLNALLSVSDLGWWWPFEEALVLTDRPVTIHRDTENRLHHADGPAISYSDGWSSYVWHGTRVPQGLIMGSWTVEDIHANSNTEIRRAAVEHMGWPAYIEAAQLKLISEEPDPGNDPYTLKLYEPSEQLFPDRVNVLVMTNGSPDRSGDLRIYAETVPAELKTAIEGAAWQYGCPVEAYVQMGRRT